MRQIIHQDGTVGLYCCGQLFLLLFEQNLHELFLAAVQNIHKLTGIARSRVRTPLKS